jgi:hypothetical protein
MKTFLSAVLTVAGFAVGTVFMVLEASDQSRAAMQALASWGFILGMLGLFGLAMAADR